MDVINKYLDKDTGEYLYEIFLRDGLLPTPKRADEIEGKIKKWKCSHRTFEEIQFYLNKQYGIDIPVDIIRELYREEAFMLREEYDEDTYLEPVKPQKQKKEKPQHQDITSYAKKIETAKSEIKELGQVLMDMLREKAPSSPVDEEYEPDQCNYTDNSESGLIVIVSDLHLGKRTKSYNTNVAMQRYRALMREASAMAKEDEPIHVVYTGDIIDGELIYPNQAHYIDTPVVAQVFNNIREMADILSDMAANNKVYVHCCYGNHGRMSREMNETTNVDLIFYKSLELAVQNLIGADDRITFNVSDEFFVNFSFGKYAGIAMHGNNVKSWQGLPYYGITRRVLNYLAGHEFQTTDLFVFGHFHVPLLCTVQRSTVIINGTFVSDDHYALREFGGTSRPTQTILRYTDDQMLECVKHYSF